MACIPESRTKYIRGPEAKFVWKTRLPVAPPTSTQHNHPIPSRLTRLVSTESGQTQTGMSRWAYWESKSQTCTGEETLLGSTQGTDPSSSPPWVSEFVPPDLVSSKNRTRRDGEQRTMYHRGEPRDGSLWEWPV